MTEKRFTIIHIGNPYDCVIKDHITDNTIGMFDSTTEPVNEIVECLNALHEEVMTLRMENTKMKLVFKEVVDDLQREADTNTPVLVRQEYVDWINENVDLRLVE